MIKKNYFIVQLYQDYRTCKLSMSLGIIIFLVHKLQMLLILLTKNVRERLFDLTSQNQYLFNTMNSTLTVSSSKYILLYIFLSFNFLLVLLFTFRIFQYKKVNRGERNLIVLFWSSCIQSYHYLFFIPSLYFSSDMGVQPPSIINAILTFLIEIFAVFLDFDYRLRQSKDGVLSKITRKYFQLLNSLMLVCLIINCASDIVGYQELIFFLFVLLNITFTLFQKVYQNTTIYQLDMLSWGFFFGLTLILLFFSSKVSSDINLFIVVIMVLPLSMKTIYSAGKNNETTISSYEKITSDYSQKNALTFITNLLQTLQDMNYSDYSQRFSSQVIDEVMISHKQSCTNLSNCFCNYEVNFLNFVRNIKQINHSFIQCQTLTAQEVWNNVISEEKRKLFILNYINSLIVKMIDDNSRKSKEFLLSEDEVAMKFIYINFLFEETKSKAMALFQLHLLHIQQQRMNFRQRMYLYYLHSIIEEDSIQFSNPSDKSYMEYLIIEDKVKSLKNIYEACLLNKLELLNQINIDHIDLCTLQSSGLSLLNNKQRMERLNREITRKWRSNTIVQEVIPCVQNSLGFKVREFDRLSDSGSIISQQSIENGNYHQKAAALIGFSNNNLGEILKATKQFGKLFEIDTAEGSSIYDFIPLEFHKDHQKLISGYLNNFKVGKQSQISEQYVNKEQTNLVFGLSKKCYCIPLIIHFNVQYISYFNQIAVMATFEEINSSNTYIAYNSKTFQVKFVSMNIIHTYFSEFINFDSINRYEVTSFMPILASQLFQENKMSSSQENRINKMGTATDDEVYSTVVIFPSREYFYQGSCFKFSQLAEMLQSTPDGENHFQLFNIQFSLYKPKLMENSPLTFIQIISIQKIITEQEYQSSLNMLKLIVLPSQLNKFLSQDNDYPMASTASRYGSPYLLSNQNFIASPRTKSSRQEIKDLEATGRDEAIENYKYGNEEQLCFTPKLALTSHRSNHETAGEQLLLRAYSNILSQFSPRNYKNSIVSDNTQCDNAHAVQYKVGSQLLSPKMITRDIEESECLHNDHVFFDSKCMSTYMQNKEESHSNLSNEKKICENLQAKINEEKQQNDSLIKQSTELKVSIQNAQKSHQLSIYKQSATFKTTDKNQNEKHLSACGVSSESKQQNLKASNPTHKLNIRKEEFERSSQNSGKSGTKVQIKAIKAKLDNKSLSTSIWMLGLFGFFCLVLIMGLSIQQFQEMVNGLTSIAFDLHFVDWPASTSTVLNNIWLQINLLLIQDSQVFPVLSQSWTNYSTDINTRVNEYISIGKNLFIDQMQSDYTIGWYFNEITYRRNSYYIGNESEPNLQMVKLAHDGDSELVFFQKYMASMYYYYIQMYNTQEEQLILTVNYDLMQSDLAFLAQQISESSIQVDVYTVVIITVSLVFFQVLLTLPIYSYIQNQREMILRLFSTFQKQSLEMMKLACIESMEGITKVDFRKYLNQKSTLIPQSATIQPPHLKKSIKTSSFESNNTAFEIFSKKATILSNLQQHTKKKLISTTSSLPKFNIVLPLFGFSIFIIICTQPIVNALIVESFKNEAITIFKALDCIFYMKDSLTKSIAFVYGNMYSKLTNEQNNNLFDKKFFELHIQDILNDGTNKLNNLNQIANTISQQESSSKSYLQVINSLMQGNICDVIQEYPDSYNLTNQVPFDYNNCISSRNGILQSGFQVSCQYFLSQMSDLQQIASISDPTSRRVQFQFWENNFNVLEFNQFYDQLSYIVAFMQTILLDNGTSRINQMWVIEICLVVAQNVNLFLIFYFGWLKFFRVISHQLLSNKQIITLFEPEFILDNPYFMSYINHLK